MFTQRLCIRKRSLLISSLLINIQSKKICGQNERLIKKYQSKMIVTIKKCVRKVHLDEKGNNTAKKAKIVTCTVEKSFERNHILRSKQSFRHVFLKIKTIFFFKTKKEK